MEGQWKQFENERIQKLPKGAKPPKAMSFKDILKLIGLGDFYAQFRIYSHFTHGAIRAAAGDFDLMTDEPDNLIIGWSVLAVLVALKQFAPVNLPELGGCRNQLTAFMKADGANCQ